MSSSASAPTPIRLLILSPSADQSEQITTSLRNGGLAVHSTRFSDPESSEEQLASNDFDIALYCLNQPQQLTQVLESIRESASDLPLILLSDQAANPGDMLQAMRNGAKDIVEKDDLEHLQLVVAREFANLQQRRELAALQKRLDETEQRCIGLIASSREAIAFIQDGMHLHVNPAYLEMFGFAEPDDIEDLPLLDMIDKSRHTALKQTLRRLDNEAKTHSVTIDTEYQLQSGEVRAGSMYIAKARMDGEPCLQVIVRQSEQAAPGIERDAQAQPAAKTRVELPDHQHFLSQLDAWVEKPDDTDLQALMYLSIDGFAQLQATLGADAIDASLDAAIERLQAHISKDDVLSRFDDSTLTLLCRRPAADAIDRFGEELRAQIAAQPLPEGSAENHLSASIGIAFMTVPITDKTAFIDEARRASQSARREGGNRVALARIKDGGETPDMEIVAQITHALEKDRFALVYQPIVSLQGDSRENYAVLVRLLGENEEELLPEKFIQQAERYHKMVDIDRWIIRQAIATLAKQRKEGRKVNFFISLSEPALLDKNLLLWVCDCLREFDARGGWLTFQIREQHVRDNLRAVTKLIEGLKKIKCQIALDHFGLLAKPDILLNHIEVDFIKLAPQLVSNINNDQAKQDALNDLNELIMGTGVKTIAMAVEDANSLTVLWTVGVGYIQGFFLQEPSRTIEYGSQQLI